MADWIAIKSEYINTDISTRDLARKYGVKYSTLRDRCAREEWSAERAKHTSNVVAKTEQKTTEAVSSSQAERIALLMSGGAKAAQLLIKHLEDMEKSGEIRPYEIKATVDAMKGIRDLYKTDGNDDTDDKLEEFLEGMKHV